MVRNLVVTILLALGLAAAVAWYFNLWPTFENLGVQGPGPTASAATKAGGKSQVDLGNLLYEPVAEPKEQQLTRPSGRDPIVVPCHMVALDVAAVPSKREGPLKFIGTEVDREDPSSPGGMMTVVIHQGRSDILKTYRPLEEGAVVMPGQEIALVDCAIAMNEVVGKKAKIVAAKADYEAAKATHQEAQARLGRLEVLKRTTPGAVPPEEFGAAILLRDKYRYEEASKSEAVKLAEIEKDQAEIVLKEHEIRNPMAGAAIIKTIFKKRGEAVKALEPVVQLQSLENLRAEGMVEVQYLERLLPGIKVSIEPSQLEAPWRVFKGHRGEITGVAISNAARPQVVSASEDGTAYVWNFDQFGPERVLFHDDQPVRVVACSPRGLKQNLCITGCADGSLRVWDLDSKNPVAQRLEDHHRAAITALAFSPDGKFFATGSEDNQICLWSAETGKKVYPFDAEHGADNPHQGTITSLHFTPQCKLVSAARDNTLRVWELHEKGVQMEPRVIGGRGGSVSNLGVTRDGRWMLFDQGKSLQILSVAEGKTVNMLQSPSSTPFETLAVFSPDASLVLTAGAPEGRLQLWRAPGVTGRAYEVRQFATNERAAVTCAAFAHDAGLTQNGSFAVSGTKDGNVYVWPVPNQEAVNQSRIENLPLTLVERSLDAGTRQVRIGVNVHNQVDQQHPYGRLMPGRPVTVVIP